LIDILIALGISDLDGKIGNNLPVYSEKLRFPKCIDWMVDYYAG
jgi:hypothetical protein